MGFENLSSQTFTIEAANKTMSNVVITYLNYNVFDTQLSTTVVPQLWAGAVPATVIRSAFKSSSNVQKVALRLLRASENHSDVGKILAEERGVFNAQSPESILLPPFTLSRIGYSNIASMIYDEELTSYKLLKVKYWNEV